MLGFASLRVKFLPSNSIPSASCTNNASHSFLSLLQAEIINKINNIVIMEDAYRFKIRDVSSHVFAGYRYLQAHYEKEAEIKVTVRGPRLTFFCFSGDSHFALLERLIPNYL